MIFVSGMPPAAAASRAYLELRDSFLLDAKDDAVHTLNTGDGGALADGLHGVLHLEQVPIRGEDGDGDCSVVSAVRGG